MHFKSLKFKAVSQNKLQTKSLKKQMLIAVQGFKKPGYFTVNNNKRRKSLQFRTRMDVSLMKICLLKAIPKCCSVLWQDGQFLRKLLYDLFHCSFGYERERNTAPSITP